MLEETRLRYFFLSSVTVVSAGLALVFASISDAGLSCAGCDANAYYNLGQKIINQGVLGFSDGLRPFGYPLFLALMSQLASRFSLDIRLIVSVTQWLILIGTSYFAFRFFYSIFRSWYWAAAIYVGITLNVFLLAYTSQILTDLLSAIAIFVAILLAIRIPDIPNSNLPKSQTVIVSAFFSFFFAGIATIIRPANLSIIGAVIVIWAIRIIVFGDISKQIVAAMSLGSCIPFIPQLINNYRTWHIIQPLVIENLYASQLQWGLAYLKYGTLMLADTLPQAFYFNPFYCEDTFTLIEFASSNPLGFLLTTCLHLFSLFDFDFLFPYITDLTPWYRVPISIFNYTFLFLAEVGIARWIHRSITKRLCDRINLVFLGLLIAIGAYLCVYLFAAVENRFSLPIYMLITPFFVYSLDWVTHICKKKQFANIAALSLGLCLYITANTAISNWVSLQAPSITGRNSGHCCKILEKQLDLRVSDHVQLLGYSYNYLPSQNQLNVLIGWRESDQAASQIKIEAQIKDTNGHLWVNTPKQTDQVCTLSAPSPEPSRGTRFVMSLPPTLPPDEYHIMLTFSDNLGRAVGNELALLTASLEKDKGSFLAGQIHIDQPYFVDMHEMRFLGYTFLPDSIQTGETLHIGVYWRARERPRGDYVVVTRIADQSKSITLEQKSKPAGGKYPTTQWNSGEVLLDWHDLLIPESIVPGSYNVEIALIDETNGALLGKVQLPSIMIVSSTK